MLYRVVRHGFTLRYEPRARVFHRHLAVLGGLHRRLYRWGVAYAAFLTKTMLTDRDARGRALHELAGVFHYHLKGRLWPSACGREDFPVRLVAAEIAGLLAGGPAYSVRWAAAVFGRSGR